MRSNAHRPAVIENDNDVSVPHRGDTLGNDDLGDVGQLFFEVMPHFGVRCKVERGKAIVKERDFWLLGNGAGNGKPLTLPARKVLAALGDLGLHPALLFEKDIRTGELSGGKERFIGERRVGKGEVLPHGAGEQNALLRGVAETRTQLLLLHCAHIRAAYLYTSLLGVKKAEHEL